MKLNDILETFYTFSGKTSDITRHLSFAGIAIIWIFRSNIPHEPLISKDLLLPSFFLVIALSCDLLQYLSGTIIWYFYHRKKEKEGLSNKKNIIPSIWLNKPIFVFFTLKIICVITGYIMIIIFLFHRIMV